MNKVRKSQNNNQNVSKANEEECHYIKANKMKINIIDQEINQM